MKRRVPALLGAAAALGLAASGPVAAAPHAADATGSADITDTETVQVYTDAAGKVDTQRVYEQLVLRGNGTVEVKNPVSTDGLRNLDGFGGTTVRDGAQVASYDLDAHHGVVRERTVSDHTAELPLKVSVRYLLDGEEVQPGDVVGASGHLKVDYTVENTTARTESVEIPDGKGGTTTREVPVAVPFAGSLATTLPEQFSDVTSKRANLAGDGHGGTKVNFTLTLFPPIGSPKTTLTWEADVADGVVPRAELIALPVNPMESPTFSAAADGYRKGTVSGVQLADGAREMDANLLKLRDGAQDLLGGLIQLRDGAGKLSAGLTDDALPGAKRLASGSKELDDGLALLDDGAGRLADGADRVNGGIGDAAQGSNDLRDGMARISAGLGELADIDGLPKAQDGAKRLKAGVDEVLAGFGAAGKEGTLLDGLTQLETGLGRLSAGLVQLKGDGSAATPGIVGAKGGVDQSKGGVDQSKSGVDQSKAGVDQVIAGLGDAVGTGGSIDQLLGGLQLLTTLDCGPTCLSVVTSKLIPGVQDSKTKLTGARNGLTQVSGGLGQVSGGLGQVSGGLGQVSGGLAQAITGLQEKLIPGAQDAADGAGKANDGAQQLAGGLGTIRQGLADLQHGLTDAVAGVLALDDGASQEHAGLGELSDGLGLLDEGSGTLAARTHELAAGNHKAHGGSSQVADGNAELADGLGDAAEGSGKVADGLVTAAGGTPQIVDGAGRLSSEGSQVIAGKGEKAAQDYGELVAVMEAGAKRADAEQMAYGAPEGAIGLTAYDFVITGEDGSGGRNLARGLAGGGLLAVAAGAGFLRRRLA